MKKYLVGGAVRDSLLGLPIHERDWVVVGATIQDMLNLGFRQVGKSFPVFLHPQSQEEYALARQEKKVGLGYHGFLCDFSPHIRLEEDLARRDLTINAIAQDEKGILIDPYGGLKDLEDKVLRHVSPAFAEDPLRVLRVARFYAKFAHLGFRLAAETHNLMIAMVQSGELRQLVAERVWVETEKSLKTENPECYFQCLREVGALKVIFPEIDALFGIPNPPKYHQEIDSGIHSLMTLKASTRLSKSPSIRFAALLHDLGKALTPVYEWPKHHGHEIRGVSVIHRLCQRLKIPKEFQSLACLGSEYHLLIHRIFELKATTIVKYLQIFDAFRRPEQLEHLLNIAHADALGCLGSGEDYPQKERWRALYRIAASVDLTPILEEGLKGEAIKNRLFTARVARVQTQLERWNQNEK